MEKTSKKSKIAAKTPTIADQPTSKKIGFFSAMLIVMGSSIGAGIFFKAKGVLESSQGSLIFAILAWLIAAFAVISMALALVEIASARNDNLSLIGWCKTFNSRIIYKASKNFMFYIYLPLTYFFMPLYVIMSLQDALSGFGVATSSAGDLFGAGSADWVIWTIISLAISAFFIFISGYSSRAGNLMNMGIMAVKFLPLIATIILGFVIAGVSGAFVSAGPVSDTGAEGVSSVVNSTNFGFMSPGIGLFIAMGAIFFAYDGFYVTAGIQSEMKEPKKTPLAIVFGLGAVTAIYLLIAISMSITGNGGLGGFVNFLAERDALWVYGLLNLTIAIGVMGILNGFAMWSPRFVEDLIKTGEIPLGQRFIHKLNDRKPVVGILYCVAVSLPIVLLFTIIGALGYVNGYGTDYGSTQMGSLYSFADLMGTWTAVFAFMFIMLPISGGLKNRKQKFVKTDQKKYFVWAAWASVILIGLVLAILFVDAFVNVFMLFNLTIAGWGDAAGAYEFTYTGDNTFMISASVYNEAELARVLGLLKITSADIIGNPSIVSNYDYLIGGDAGLIGRIMKLVMLFIFVGLMLVPTIIEDRVHIKKFGSLEKYEKSLNLKAA